MNAAALTEQQRKLERLHHEMNALPIRLRIGSITVDEYKAAVAKLKAELDALKDQPVRPANTR